MNPDNTVPDREELERITAPKASMKLAGSSETADSDLRQTWLAMGGMLDRNTPASVNVDEARIRASILNRGEERFHWGRAAVWAGLAMAASVIFALWIMHGIMANDQIRRQEIVRAPDEPTSHPTSARSPKHAVIEVAWDDQMTGRIAQVHTGVRHLHATPGGAPVSTQATRHDDRVDALRSRINTLQRAWGANKL